MAHSEVAYKYFLKAFYTRTNKKEYKSQILQYIIRHTNILIMQNIILLAKVDIVNRKKVAVNTPIREVARAYNAINVWLKYNWLLNYIDNKVAMNLGL